MTEHSFSLIPFPASAIPELSITGTISRRDDFLALRYILTGDIDDIFFPSPVEQPSRKDDLWMTTCFEFFLARKDRPQYWELNLSPSGDWNVYRMDAYRRIGFQREMSVQRLPFEMRKELDSFILSSTLDLSPLFQHDDLLEAGITAVIQTKDGNETYWALAHPGPQADFHLRESFILPLAEQAHPLPQSSPGG